MPNYRAIPPRDPLLCARTAELAASAPPQTVAPDSLVEEQLTAGGDVTSDRITAAIVTVPIFEHAALV